MFKLNLALIIFIVFLFPVGMQTTKDGGVAITPYVANAWSVDLGLFTISGGTGTGISIGRGAVFGGGTDDADDAGGRTERKVIVIDISAESAQHEDIFGEIIGQYEINGEIFTTYACVNAYTNIVDSSGKSIDRIPTPPGICSSCAGDTTPADPGGGGPGGGGPGGGGPGGGGPGGGGSCLKTCIVYNSCGSFNSQKVSCNTDCTVLPPDNPSYFQSACSESYTANVCGKSVNLTRYGQKGCLNKCVNYQYPMINYGTCEIKDPVCIPGIDPKCSFTIGVADLSISANPNLVKSGATAQITWRSIYADSCSVKATGNSDSWNGVHGSEESQAIISRTDYLLSCTYKGSSTILTASTTIHIIPRWQEF